MASYFPCPNPACSYQFDAEQLPAAAMVTCPLCKTRFPYRAAGPAQPSDESDEPWGGGKDAPRERDRGAPRPNRLINPRQLPQSNTTQRMLMLVGFTLFVAVVLFLVMYAFRKNPFKSDGDTSETFTNDEFNFTFRKFDKNWKEDRGLQRRMGVSGFAERRADPEAYVVVHGKDFGMKNPRPGEMRNEMLSMLRTTFKGLERSPLDDKIADQPADGVRFSGELDGTAMTGEGFAFHYKGIGYMLLVFAPLDSWEQARKELDTLRRSFAFANLRNSWQESEASIEHYFIPEGNYEVIDEDGVWERALELPKDDDDPLDPVSKKKAPPPKKGAYVLTSIKDKDEHATMAFRAFLPVKAKYRLDHRPKVEALTLVFDKAEGEPLEAARAYWYEKLKKDEGGEGVEITFKPLDKAPSGAATPKSDASIGIYQSIHSLDRTAKKLFIMSALKIGDKVVAVVVWGLDRDAEYMEQYMLKFAASLRERK
jgi:hypothetical protein